jgi:hypothetical protein
MGPNNIINNNLAKIFEIKMNNSKRRGHYGPPKALPTQGPDNLKPSSNYPAITDSAKATVSIPQPMSTPTMDGAALSVMVMIVPIAAQTGVNVWHDADGRGGELGPTAQRLQLFPNPFKSFLMRNKSKIKIKLV